MRLIRDPQIPPVRAQAPRVAPGGASFFYRPDGWDQAVKIAPLPGVSTEQGRREQARA